LAQVQQMKTNSWLVTLKPLPQNDDDKQQLPPQARRIELVQESFYKMSWQMAKVYFYRIH